MFWDSTWEYTLSSRLISWWISASCEPMAAARVIYGKPPYVSSSVWPPKFLNTSRSSNVLVLVHRACFGTSLSSESRSLRVDCVTTLAPMTPFRYNRAPSSRAESGPTRLRVTASEIRLRAFLMTLSPRLSAHLAISAASSSKLRLRWDKSCL